MTLAVKHPRDHNDVRELPRGTFRRKNMRFLRDGPEDKRMKRNRTFYWRERWATHPAQRRLPGGSR